MKTDIRKEPHLVDKPRYGCPFCHATGQLLVHVDHVRWVECGHIRHLPPLMRVESRKRSRRG